MRSKVKKNSIVYWLLNKGSSLFIPSFTQEICLIPSQSYWIPLQGKKFSYNDKERKNFCFEI